MLRYEPGVYCLPYITKYSECSPLNIPLVLRPFYINTFTAMLFKRTVCNYVGENHAHRACTMQALYLIREVTAFHQNKPDVDRLRNGRAIAQMKMHWSE